MAPENDGPCFNQNESSVALGSTTASGNAIVQNIGIANINNWKPSLEERSKDYTRGLCLLDAPLIDDHLFVGRDYELEEIGSALLKDQESGDQKTVVLGGLGGIGKTQIALRYAKRYKSSYSSVFWLNATSESTLLASIRRIAAHVFQNQDFSQLEDQQLWTKVSLWLSEIENKRWLVIFDNYDDPNEYEIGKYRPIVAHGSVIITTRQPDEVGGYHIKVKPMSNINESLQILAARSKRVNTFKDAGARQLAQRLEGLPLALATAGAFLKQSSVSFSKYLQQYEKKWQITSEPHRELPDYRTRTLYTTWNISFAQIEQQMPRAARLLAFFAYLDHQDIWYDLLQAQKDDESPEWFRDVMANEFAFEETMAILVRYCLVESQPHSGSYGLHVCVHDWTLDGLDRDIDSSEYWLALKCVASHVSNKDLNDLSTVQYHRLTPHAVRLSKSLFQRSRETQRYQTWDYYQADAIGQLLYMQVQYAAAERMWLSTLTVTEGVLGPKHIWTLEIVNNLGALYDDQGKLDKAEKMYERALQGREETLGSRHISTLNTVNNLGILYKNQGKLDEAEKMCKRALQGCEETVGPKHLSTLATFNNLGLVYMDQGKLDEAEKMFKRALQGRKETLGLKHLSTLGALYNLGILYKNQGKLDEAEKMCKRALQGCEETVGPKHLSTLVTFNNLGLVYMDQGKLDEAEKMYELALQGFEEALGLQHISTLSAVDHLGYLFLRRGRIDQPSPAPRRILDILPLLERYGANSSSLFEYLGEVLLMSRDEDGARQSYYQLYLSTGSLWTEAPCQGCDKLDLEQHQRFICKVCFDINLCMACYQQYSSNASFLDSCVGHDFLTLSFDSHASLADNPETHRTRLIRQLVERYEGRAMV